MSSLLKMELYRRHRDLNALVYILIALVLIPLCNYVAIAELDWKTQVGLETLFAGSFKAAALIYLIIVVIRTNIYYSTGFIKNFGNESGRKAFFGVRIVSCIIDLVETYLLWFVINVIMCAFLAGRVVIFSGSVFWKGLIISFIIDFSLGIFVMVISIMTKNIMAAAACGIASVLGIIDSLIGMVWKIIPRGMQIWHDCTVWLLGEIKENIFEYLDNWSEFKNGEFFVTSGDIQMSSADFERCLASNSMIISGIVLLFLFIAGYIYSKKSSV